MELIDDGYSWLADRIVRTWLTLGGLLVEASGRHRSGIPLCGIIRVDADTVLGSGIVHRRELRAVHAGYQTKRLATVLTVTVRMSHLASYICLHCYMFSVFSA